MLIIGVHKLSVKLFLRGVDSFAIGDGVNVGFREHQIGLFEKFFVQFFYTQLQLFRDVFKPIDLQLLFLEPHLKLIDFLF
jgi:hypothetical protein